MIYVGTYTISHLPEYLPCRFPSFWEVLCKRYGPETVKLYLEDFTVHNTEKNFKDHEHLRNSFSYYVRQEYLKNVSFTEKRHVTTNNQNPNPYDEYLTEEAYHRIYGRPKPGQSH